ncbi:MAG: GAF domain-containing protein [Anaerolineae bacterium]|jgi:GAF domain-containing protein|nr:GAF domain-containing protein [Anaerolineae bacterium]
MPSEKGAIVSLFERLGEWEQAGEISPLAKHHAQSLLIDFIRLQTQVSQRLAKSITFVEIAGALAKDVIAKGQFFSVNLFNQDALGNIQNLTCVATASRHDAYPVNFLIDVPISRMSDLYKPIFEDGVPVYIPDTHQYPLLRVEFNDKVVESYIIFPMRSKGRTIGIINLNSTVGAIEPTPFQMEWYQSLVDIATSQIELYNLIEESTISHDLSQRQAEVFNQLSAGQTYVDMAQIIAKYLLPEQGRSLAMVEFDYTGDKVNRWVIRAVANRNRLLEWDFERELRWQDLSESVQARMLAGETVMVDDSDLMSADVLGKYFSEWLKGRGVNSLFSVTISNGRIPIGAMIVMSRQKRAFNRDVINAFQNVSEMVGALTEVRVLSQQTSTAQQFATKLIEANRAVSTAEDYSEMARLLIDLLPPEIQSLSITFFDRAISMGDVPKSATMRVFATRDRIETPNTSDDFTNHPNPEAFKGIINTLLQSDYTTVPDLRPPYQALIQNSTNYLVEQGVFSTYNVRLRVAGRVIGVMNLGKEVGYEISPLQQNNLFAIADQLALTIENRRLLNDTQVVAESLSTQVRALRIINDLSSALGSLQDENAVMEKTVRALVDAVNIDHVGITLLTDGGDKAVVVAEHPKVGTVGMTFSAKDDEFQRRLRNQTQPIIINQVATSTEISPETRNALMQTPIRSIAILPLIDVRAGFIGSVGLDLYDENRSFSTTMMDFARTITAQMAVTIQNIRLLQNTRRQSRQMEAIAGFSQSLQTVLDVEALLKIALEDIRQILPADRLVVLMLNTTLNRWCKVAYNDGSKVVVDMANDTPLALSNITGGQVIKTQRMFSANDLKKSEYQFTTDETIVSSISLPLTLRGALMGVVEIGSLKPNTYSNTDSAIFQQLVSQMGIGIENAETYGQSQRLAKSKALVNDIASQLQKQTDIDQILNVTLSELGKAIGAKRARIRLMTRDEN